MWGQELRTVDSLTSFAGTGKDPESPLEFPEGTQPGLPVFDF